MKIKQKLKEVARVVILRLFGETVFKSLRSGYWVKRIKNGDFYEEEINALRLFVHEGDTCLDIGANFGQYAYILSRMVGNKGSVFCFEPSNYTVGVLKEVVEKLNLSNVTIENSALGDSVRDVNFVIPIEKESSIPNVATAHIKSDEESNIGSEEMIHVTTMDDYFNGKDVREVSFVKCDVEGAELMVFRGGEKFLSEHKPVILCEVVEDYEKRYDYSPKNLLDFMGKLGYKVFIYERTRGEGKFKPVTSIESGTINYFFIHESDSLLPS